MSDAAAPSANRPPAFRDLEHELASTRRILERVPEEHWTWTPHEKSMPLGRLATHLIEVLRLAEGMLLRDTFDIAEEHLPEPNGRDDLLRAYDAAAADLRAAADSLAPDAWRAHSRLVYGDRVIVELPRAGALRGVGISHVIHHRGQLSVYLRLLDVPVPGLYGPSADERGA